MRDVLPWAGKNGRACDSAVADCVGSLGSTVVKSSSDTRPTEPEDGSRTARPSDGRHAPVVLLTALPVSVHPLGSLLQLRFAAVEPPRQHLGDDVHVLRDRTVVYASRGIKSAPPDTDGVLTHLDRAYLTTDTARSRFES